MRNIYLKPQDISYTYYIIYSCTTTAIAKLILLANIGPREKFHFQLPSLLILWFYRKKIIYVMSYKCGGLRQQRTEDQAFVSLRLQTDQFCKRFTTQTRSLSSQDFLLAVLAYIQHQIKLFSLNSICLQRMGRGEGEGRVCQIDPRCGFSKNVSSRERLKPWFFVTFNIVSKHIFLENFI